MISAKGTVRLQDAVQALDYIASFIDGQTIDNYLANAMLRSAVERQLAIVGEALTVFRRLDPEVAVSINDLPRAIVLRNFLLHDYGAVDDEIVWQIGTFYAPTLREMIIRVLEA